MAGRIVAVHSPRSMTEPPGTGAVPVRGLVVAVLAPQETTDPAGVAAGHTGGGPVGERRTRTPEAETVETVWRGISEGLDAADDDEARLAFLAKAVLLLAINRPEPAAIHEAIDLAAQQR